MKYLVQSRLREHRVVDVDAQNSAMAAHILMTEKDPGDLPAEVSSYTSPDKDAWVSLGKKSFTKMTDISPTWLEAFSETVSKHGLREPMTFNKIGRGLCHAISLAGIGAFANAVKNAFPDGLIDVQIDESVRIPPPS